MFKKGDKVTHKLSKGMDTRMHAIFIKYYGGYLGGDKKVLVEYTTGHKKGDIGEWKEKYCQFLGTVPSHHWETLPHVSEEKAPTASEMWYHEHYIANPGININIKRKHDDLLDAVSLGTIHMAIDWAEGCQPKTNPEEIMKATISELYVDGVLIQTLVNERDLEDMSSSDLLHAIGNTEAAIEKLTKHNGAKSKFIGQEMKRLVNFVDSVYLLLDQKFYNKTEVEPVDKTA